MEELPWNPAKWQQTTASLSRTEGLASTTVYFPLHPNNMDMNKSLCTLGSLLPQQALSLWPTPAQAIPLRWPQQCAHQDTTGQHTPQLQPSHLEDTVQSTLEHSRPAPLWLQTTCTGNPGTQHYLHWLQLSQSIMAHNHFSYRCPTGTPLCRAS